MLACYYATTLDKALSSNETWQSPATDALLDTVLGLPDRAAAERFFRDLCTLRELRDLAQRWHVVRLLGQGRHYQEIARETGASTATVTRIAQWLNHGTGGYREALERAAHSDDRPYPITAEQH